MKKTDSISYPSEFRKIFELWYNDVREVSYYWTGKDAKNCIDLSKKILFLIKTDERKKGNEILPDNEYKERVLQGFQFILSVCLNDNVVDEHLSISVLNSRFNQIIAKRDGKSTNNTRQRKRESDISGFSLSNVD